MSLLAHDIVQRLEQSRNMHCNSMRVLCREQEIWLCELHCIFILPEKKTGPQICNVVDTIIVPEFKNSLGSTPIVINNACRAGEKIQSFVTNITCLHSTRRTHMRYNCILSAVGENSKVMTIASIQPAAGGKFWPFEPSKSYFCIRKSLLNVSFAPSLPSFHPPPTPEFRSKGYLLFLRDT